MNGGILMKNGKRLLICLMVMLLALTAVGCLEPKAQDGAQGTYNFVKENMAVFSNSTYDYQFILDGLGTGNYLHKGSEHKVKYEYNSADHTISIKDTMTGIKYTGTLSESGELHIYDGNPNSPMVSEFYYQRQ